MTHMEHVLLFGSFMVASWFLFTYFWPRMLLSVYKRAILVKGFGDGPVPVNTLYTEPQALFADPLHAPASASKLGDDWREPRHTRNGWLARSLQRGASSACAGHGRSLLQRAIYESVGQYQFCLRRQTHHGHAGRRLSHYGARLERNRTARNETDILAEQLCTRLRSCVRGKRQRPVDGL